MRKTQTPSCFSPLFLCFKFLLFNTHIFSCLLSDVVCLWIVSTRFDVFFTCKKNDPRIFWTVIYVWWLWHGFDMRWIQMPWMGSTKSSDSAAASAACESAGTWPAGILWMWPAPTRWPHHWMADRSRTGGISQTNEDREQRSEEREEERSEERTERKEEKKNECYTDRVVSRSPLKGTLSTDLCTFAWSKWKRRYLATFVASCY